MYKIGKQDLSSIFGFITIGLLLGHIGPLLSVARVDLGVEAGVVGRTIAVYYGISILGILAGFFLIKRIGKEWFLLSGSILLMMAYGFGLGIESSRDLIVVCVFLGLGLGTYQIGINSLAVERISKLPESKQAGRMAYMQFFFGIGAVIAPLLVDWSQQHFNNWRLSFVMVLILGPLVSGSFIVRELLEKGKRAIRIQQTNVEHGDHAEAAVFHAIQWSSILVLMLLAACLYTSLETSVFNWLSYFWDTRWNELDIVTGAKASAVFWFVFSFSRFSMGWVVMKLGDWKAMLIFSSIVLVNVALWWIFDPHWTVLLGMVVVISLMMGCMFPTIMIVISRMQPGDSSQVVGILFVIGTASASIVPLGIGQAIKLYDLSMYPLLLLSLGVLFLSTLTIVFLMQRKQS